MSAIAVKERPILLKGDELMRVAAGEQTQLRIMLDPQPRKDSEGGWVKPGRYSGDISFYIERTEIKNGVRGEPVRTRLGIPEIFEHWKCPVGKVGDGLWVKEKWAVSAAYDHCGARSPHIHNVAYADGSGFGFENGTERGRWRSPIHMPRWATRIVLEVTGIEILQSEGRWYWFVGIKKCAP